MAKELSMVERTTKGKVARLYFILTGGNPLEFRRKFILSTGIPLVITLFPLEFRRKFYSVLWNFAGFPLEIYSVLLLPAV